MLPFCQCRKKWEILLSHFQNHPRRVISPKSCYLRCHANDTVTDFELGVWTENEERRMCYCGQDCNEDDEEGECCGDYGESAYSNRALK